MTTYNNIIAFDKSFYRFTIVKDLWTMVYINSCVNLDRVYSNREKEVNRIKERKFLSLFKDNLDVRGSNDGITNNLASTDWWTYKNDQRKDQEHIIYNNVDIYIEWDEKLPYKHIEAYLYNDRIFLKVSTYITHKQLELVLETTDILKRRKKAKSLLGGNRKGNSKIKGSFYFNSITIQFEYTEKQ